MKFRSRQIDLWLDCGTLEALLETNRLLLDDRSASVTPDGVQSSYIIPPVHIAADAIVERSVIGPYVSIGSGAHLSEVVIRDSIIGEQVFVQGITLFSSVIGNRVQINGVPRKLILGDDSQVDTR